MSAEMKSCVVLLGASAFPNNSELDNPTIAASARALKDYFLETRELCVEAEHFLNLFNAHANATDQMLAVRKHLGAFNKDAADVRKNVFLLYVGHGLLEDGQFSLAIASTDRNAQTVTSLNVSALAQQIKLLAAWSRRFVILDCCFAGEALKDFLSEEGLSRTAEHAFEAYETRHASQNPKRGTTVLCASDRYTRALASRDRQLTMFTGALIDVLRIGSSDAPSMLTLGNVLQLVRDKLWQADVPKPVLVSPDQTEGDLAQMLRLFPNRGASEDLPPTPEPRTEFILGDRFEMNHKGVVGEVGDDVALPTMEPSAAKSLRRGLSWPLLLFHSIFVRQESEEPALHNPVSDRRRAANEITITAAAGFRAAAAMLGHLGRSVHIGVLWLGIGVTILLAASFLLFRGGASFRSSPTTTANSVSSGAATNPPLAGQSASDVVATIGRPSAGKSSPGSAAQPPVVATSDPTPPDSSAVRYSAHFDMPTTQALSPSTASTPTTASSQTPVSSPSPASSQAATAQPTAPASGLFSGALSKDQREAISNIPEPPLRLTFRNPPHRASAASPNGASSTRGQPKR
ncbi:caspase family protein [Paraburkholderia xenovorans]|uniref:caspase family protein n=1 Tax=Paraburkholderia xenovorans TaxID=36873 RepID=UPI0038B9795A